MKKKAAAKWLFLSPSLSVSHALSLRGKHFSFKFSTHLIRFISDFCHCFSVLMMIFSRFKIFKPFFLFVNFLSPVSRICFASPIYCFLSLSTWVVMLLLRLPLLPKILPIVFDDPVMFSVNLAVHACPGCSLLSHLSHRCAYLHRAPNRHFPAPRFQSLHVRKYP